MDSTNQALVPVPFEEHPFTQSRISPSNELAIHLHSEFSFQLYCESLFQKVLTIGLSEIPDFLNYHCQQVKNPISWINSLDKLIKVNAELFNGKQAEHRHYKFISQIDIHRFGLQTSSLGSHRHKLLLNNINGFSEKKEYCFKTVKDHLTNLLTHEEKIDFLQDHIFDYRQDSPDFIYTKEKAFDVLCELEIEKLEKKELSQQKAAQRKSKNPSNMMSVAKIKITCNLNYFCDVIFQLINESSSKKGPYLISTPAQMAQFIVQNFVDKDGNEISYASVLTFLDPNRPDKRPKSGKRFNVYNDED
jgi:hypothetical protein